MRCVTWKPVGTIKDEYIRLSLIIFYLPAFIFPSFPLTIEEFLGTTPRLKNESLIVSGDDRKTLRTKSSGVVHFTLGIITKEFDKMGVATGTQIRETPSAGD